MHNMVQKSFSAVLVLGLTACANGDMAEGGADGATEIRVLTVGGTRIAMQALQAQWQLGGVERSASTGFLDLPTFPAAPRSCTPMNGDYSG